jgi:hypothetical protein
MQWRVVNHEQAGDVARLRVFEKDSLVVRDGAGVGALEFVDRTGNADGDGAFDDVQHG